MIPLYDKIKEFIIGEFKIDQSDFYSQEKLNLTFNFVFIGFTVLLIPIIFFEMFSVQYERLGVWLSELLCITILLVLKYQKNQFLASLIFSNTFFTICILNLFFNPQTIHFGFPFWIMIIALYSVFTLSLFWGIIFGSFGALSFIFYKFFIISNIEIVQNSASMNIAFIFEVIFGSLLILYLINLYLKTSRKAEKELIKQNDDKTILLKEVHHRVKNNLQLISSILRIQSRKISDPKSLEIFELSQNRIYAMALIHERLYKEDKQQFKLNAEYIEKLALDLINLNSNNQKINFKTSLQHTTIQQKNIISFGLILNELISNSLKHGVKNEGDIELTSSIDKNQVKLTYRDNGIGFDVNSKPGFGLELIESLSEQMNGNVVFESNPGEGVQVIIEYIIKSN